MGSFLASVLKTLPETVVGGLVGNEVISALTPKTTTSAPSGSTVQNGPSINAAAFSTLDADTKKMMIAAGYHIV